MADVRDTRNAQLIYTHPVNIWDFAVQPDGPYIAIIAKHIIDADVFLYDRTRPNEPARNLTQQQYGDVKKLDISKNGDIIFTNLVSNHAEKDLRNAQETGIFLIPHHELNKEKPSAKLLVPQKRTPSDLTWSPAADQIAYAVWPMEGFRIPGVGVYIFDIKTSRITQISRTGYDPAFSPDGKKFAFHTRDEIVITEPRARAPQHIVPLDMRAAGYLSWTPDGKHIVHGTFGLGPAITNIQDGSQRIIFDQFDRIVWIWLDWVHTEAYPVEPAGRMVIPWGSLKK
ncbi:hypothetical protein C6501_14855 [Candidatus Poribacteria bacterium]|nr:MAG: hypothetical protein C6501_14855 [Candidatus Poribacteria bacterium]